MRNLIKNVFQSIKRNFLAGIIVIVPLVVTYYLIKTLILLIANYLPDRIFYELFPILKNYQFTGIDYLIKLVAFSVTFFAVLLTGYFFSNYLGKKILNLWEKILDKLPLINRIYSIIKQIIEQIISSLQNPQKEIFQKVVLIEYPRKNVYCIGFISSVNERFNNMVNKKLFNVFVPTTPNPTSGFLLIVPEEEFIYVDISIENAMKYIISAGIVVDNIDSIKNNK